MHAVENDHLEMVKLLIKEGAEVNASSAGLTLMLAESKDHVEVAKYLRSKGAK
jgi:ankyrin repeat protein